MTHWKDPEDKTEFVSSRPWMAPKKPEYVMSEFWRKKLRNGNSAQKRVGTNLRGKVKLSTGTARIRFKLDNKCIVTVGINEILGIIGRVPRDVAKNAVVGL